MSETAPLQITTVEVKPEWVDYNGHMNDAFYAVAFGEALMSMTDTMGLDAEGRRRTGRTIYTLSMLIRFLNEAPEGAPLAISGRILEADEKRIRVWAEMHHTGTGTLLATTEQLFLCVDQAGGTPKAAAWPEPFAARLRDLAAAHRGLPVPEGAGDGIRLKRQSKPGSAP